MGLRKGFLEERMLKLSEVKGKDMARPYSRARKLQGIWLWSQRAAGPGLAELQPQAVES